MDIDRLIDSYLCATFGSTEAYQQDPLFHTQVKWLRNICYRLDEILKSEEMDDRTCSRIITGLLAHVMEDPMLAHERIAKFHANIAELKASPLGFDQLLEPGK